MPQHSCISWFCPTSCISCEVKKTGLSSSYSRRLVWNCLYCSEWLEMVPARSTSPCRVVSEWLQVIQLCSAQLQILHLVCSVTCEEFSFPRQPSMWRFSEYRSDRWGSPGSSDFSFLEFLFVSRETLDSRQHLGAPACFAEVISGSRFV